MSVAAELVEIKKLEIASEDCKSGRVHFSELMNQNAAQNRLVKVGFLVLPVRRSLYCTVYANLRRAEICAVCVLIVLSGFVCEVL